MAERHDALIRELAAGLRPVRTLPAPWARALLWGAAAAGLAAALAVPFGAATLRERLAGLGEQMELAAAVLTALAAAAAALILAVPGRARAWAWLPAPPLLLWVAATGFGCWTTVSTGKDLAQAPDPAGCFRFILAAAFPLAWLLARMLRRGYCVQPRLAATLAGLAAATAAAALLDLHHPDTLTPVDLAAHLGAIGIVTLASAAWLPRFIR